MPDSVHEGFGANTPVTLTTATVDVLCRYIAAPPDSFARIRSINFAAAQTAAAFLAGAALPIFVIRGAANLGVSAAAGGGLVVPLRPTGLVLPGMPDVGQIGGGVELLFASYYRLSQAGVPLVFSDDEELDADLVARDTQRIVVCVGPLVDLGASPPVLIAGGSAAVSMTVLGSLGKITSRTENPGFLGAGKTSSIPRFDVNATEHAERNGC